MQYDCGACASDRRFLAVALIFVAIMLPCALLYRAVAPGGSWRLFSGIPKDDHKTEIEEVRLRRVLKAAAMENNAVILTTLNAAWSAPGSVADLFLESFRIGDGTRELLDHVVMIAMDDKAYARCTAMHKHCFALVTEGVDFSRQTNFMTGVYMKMMWRRLEFLGFVLQLGYTFIFTDTDIMWFRNPFPHFHPDGDFQIACDQFVGNAIDLKNRPNAGFKYVKSNNNTIQFYKFWYSGKERYPGHNEQDVLNFIKGDAFVRNIGLKIRFLDTAYFGGLCEPSRDLNKVVTMHANCCIGLGRKVHDLGVMLEDWRRFTSLPAVEKQSGAVSWRVPQNCSLAPLG